MAVLLNEDNTKAARAGVHYDRKIGRLFLSIVDRAEADKTWSHFREVANYLLANTLYA